jgi:hypothetical protein
MISTTKKNMFDFILSIWNIALSTIVANEYLTLVLITFTIVLNVIKIYKMIKDLFNKKDKEINEDDE